MKHVARIERWSLHGGDRGPGALHAFDARAKMFGLLTYLIAVAVSPVSLSGATLGFAALMVLAMAVSGLPAASVLKRAGWVLPFAGFGAVITWWTGDPAGAIAILVRSYLSGLAVVFFMATTPFPAWMSALSAWRLPRLLIQVIQFLYRYLFVIPDQAHRMQNAAACRSAGISRVALVRKAAAGSVGVLFARSWQHADAIYGAMLSRGYRGRFPIRGSGDLSTSDIAFAASIALVSVALTYFAFRGAL